MKRATEKKKQTSNHHLNNWTETGGSIYFIYTCLWWKITRFLSLEFQLSSEETLLATSGTSVSVPEKTERARYFLVLLWLRRVHTAVLWRGNDGNESKVYDVTVAITTLKCLSHATRDTWLLGWSSSGRCWRRTAEILTGCSLWIMEILSNGTKQYALSKYCLNLLLRKMLWNL